MKKCGICGKEISITFKMTEWYDVEPEQFKVGRRYKPERVVKKRYVQKLCWECNQNRGRLLSKEYVKPDEYSEYLSLKYDFQNSDLPKFKIERLKELKKTPRIIKIEKDKLTNITKKNPYIVEEFKVKKVKKNQRITIKGELEKLQEKKNTKNREYYFCSICKERFQTKFSRDKHLSASQSWHNVTNSEVKYWIQKGTTYRKSGEYQKAIDCLKKILAINPRLCDAKYYLRLLQSLVRGNKKSKLLQR